MTSSIVKLVQSLDNRIPSGYQSPKKVASTRNISSWENCTLVATIVISLFPMIAFKHWWSTEGTTWLWRIQSIPNSTWYKTSMSITWNLVGAWIGVNWRLTFTNLFVMCELNAKVTNGIACAISLSSRMPTSWNVCQDIKLTNEPLSTRAHLNGMILIFASIYVVCRASFLEKMKVWSFFLTTRPTP